MLIDLKIIDDGKRDVSCRDLRLLEENYILKNTRKNMFNRIEVTYPKIPVGIRGHNKRESITLAGTHHTEQT